MDAAAIMPREPAAAAPPPPLTASVSLRTVIWGAALCPLLGMVFCVAWSIVYHFEQVMARPRRRMMMMMINE